jgi:hypothetical protein
MYDSHHLRLLDYFSGNMVACKAVLLGDSGVGKHPLSPDGPLVLTNTS